MKQHIHDKLSKVLFLSLGAAVLSNTAHAAKLDFLHIQHGDYSINAYQQYENGIVTMYKTDYFDGDQAFEWVQDNIRLFYNRGLCLNAYQRFNGASVILWSCDYNDPDQAWDYNPVNNTIELSGTGYCLNAHNVSNGSVLNLWRCDANDPDQLFILQKALVMPRD